MEHTEYNEYQTFKKVNLLRAHDYIVSLTTYYHTLLRFRISQYVVLCAGYLVVHNLVIMYHAL